MALNVSVSASRLSNSVAIARLAPELFELGRSLRWKVEDDPGVPGGVGIRLRPIRHSRPYRRVDAARRRDLLPGLLFRLGGRDSVPYLNEWPYCVNRLS